MPLWHCGWSGTASHGERRWPCCRAANAPCPLRAPAAAAVTRPAPPAGQFDRELERIRHFEDMLVDGGALIVPDVARLEELVAAVRR